MTNLELVPEYEEDKNQLELFEARLFLGRLCLIVDGVVYPQFEEEVEE